MELLYNNFLTSFNKGAEMRYFDYLLRDNLSHLNTKRVIFLNTNNKTMRYLSR